MVWESVGRFFVELVPQFIRVPGQIDHTEALMRGENIRKLFPADRLLLKHVVDTL